MQLTIHYIKSSGQSEASAPATQGEAVAVPEPSELAIRYHRSGNVLWAAETGLGLLIPALLLFSGMSARLRTLAERVGRRWLATVALYALLFTLLTALLTLPVAYYAAFLRQHEYGLSNQTFGRWMGEWLKGSGVSAIGLSLVLWIPYFLLRLSAARWWLYAGLATVPLTTVLLVISPIWVDPIFNDYGPMKDKALEARIVALARRAGIGKSRVYQVNKSIDTRAVNAYVTGFGGSKRIVLWDTSVGKLTGDQIVFVTAHEMGHFVLRHTLAVILGATILTTTSLYVVHRLAGGLIGRFSSRFGFQRLSDVASFPLLLLLGGVVSLILAPGVMAFSRYQEREADRFALEITRNNRAAAATFVRLQEENLAVPRPGSLYMLWRGSHPALGDRIDFANRYRPWGSGDKLRYQHLFK